VHHLILRTTQATTAYNNHNDVDSPAIKEQKTLMENIPIYCFIVKLGMHMIQWMTISNVFWQTDNN